MRPSGPTFWLLNGATGWRRLHGEGVAESDGAGIRLAADPNGPLSLNSVDGSLGGLVLPRGMAYDDRGILHLTDGSRIKRFNPVKQVFEPLPTIGGRGSEAREFDENPQIAIASNDLYIVDTGNQRVQVFSLNSLSLRYLWGPVDPTATFNCCTDSGSWNPVDLAAFQDVALILDSSAGKVYAHHIGAAKPELIIHEPESAGNWSRVAIDNEKRIYLLNAVEHKLKIYSETGAHLGYANDSGDVLDRFPTTGIRLDHNNRFCLSENLNKICPDKNRQSVSAARPLTDCRVNGGGLLFNRNGTPATLPQDPEPAGPLLYQKTGAWISSALDSKIYNCQWHRIEAPLSALPDGTKVIVKTYTDSSERSLEDIMNLPDNLWQSQAPLLGHNLPAQANEPAKVDSLVLSHEGQYLWLRIELYSDGYATPIIQSAKIHYPRESYINYLPAVFSADDESRRFMERFLSLFQSVWDDMEMTVENVARFFDPSTVPEGGFLTYLAQWLALPLEGAWTEEQKRRLLEAAPAAYERRGTPESLRNYLKAYLANITGLEPEQQNVFPMLIEGFRKRDYLNVTGGKHSELSRNHMLWSRSVVSRMQLDSFSSVGEVRLVSTKDPERDVFHAHAHKFQVFIPSHWIKSRNDEDMLLRALNTEKPAHTDFDLCLVEPRMRVGIQSTIGIDTILGDYPRTVLHSTDDQSLPRNQAPRQRLGYDTVLSAKTKRMGGIPLHPNVHMGMNTIIS